MIFAGRDVGQRFTLSATCSGILALVSVAFIQQISVILTHRTRNYDFGTDRSQVPV
jgi:hypothetical protein